MPRTSAAVHDLEASKQPAGVVADILAVHASLLSVLRPLLLVYGT